MTTPAYSHIYLGRAARAIGNMLHHAVLEVGYDGNEFLWLFIQSGIAAQIENGNPKYAAGKSGMELFSEIMECTAGRKLDSGMIETYEKSDVYWVGWSLTHYQWYSGHSFLDILETVSYDSLLGLYGTLHEADIQKTYDILDTHFEHKESNLKRNRKRCRLTQEELSALSGVSLNTIRAYERKAKAINKAQVEIVLSLSKALQCNLTDLLD